MPSERSLHVAAQRWPLAKTFTISRGSKDAADVVICALSNGTSTGRGECVPYPRYGESTGSVIAQIEAIQPQLEAGLSREALQRALPPGAARFAMDAALWDLEAKETGRSVWEILDIDLSAMLTTAYTIVYNTAEAMGRDAKTHRHRPLLKIKLASRGDLDRLKAVRDNAPNAQLIVDANEGWTLDGFEAIAPALERLGVTTVEQPLPARENSALKAGAYPFDLCADESVHDRASLAAIAGHYDMINIKLDKTGGLTEALKLKDAARAAGLKIMVGCMVGTSLAMAPAMALAHDADVVDLDGPLLLKQDRPDGIAYKSSQMHWPSAQLWGS